MGQSREGQAVVMADLALSLDKALASNVDTNGFPNAAAGYGWWPSVRLNRGVNFFAGRA
jgi:hypothetical protein